MYTNILLPHDADHQDGLDLPLFAAKGILAAGGKITILTIIENPPAYVAESLPEDYSRQVERAVTSTVQRQIGEDSRVHLVTLHGNPSQTILDYAKKYQIDCMVMSAKRLGVKDILLGSVTQRIVRRAHCPVLVVR